MSTVPARDLRNNVSDVLRRVERGERLTVTVSGRPVAELAPLSQRPSSLSWEDFVEGAEDWRADPSLAEDLREMVPETTDDAPIQ